MPIYAYKCGACGHAKDVLQKISDAPLTQCPECGADAFSKQVTAAGFQLKGSGWYVTDFRNNGSSGGAKSGSKDDSKSGDSASAKSDAAGKSDSGAATPASAPASSPAPAAAT
ncbi:FmdB family zinc ribbon protein [Bordetella genomosp. 9]|uniref:FmdB family transcriptional regulator n=1 Tax=Bordetella genomosp. 9 TaxID=1416803 RepID=A0A1W6Z4L9_9BORD|nr:FmdB family zinc ribbon protein [Bordetella genomosp. 9]ARP88288.1 FmdB family transcriptional regulator [Bordetella genomosp. 9]ARP92259.1 FmdB family transcriptional regulator [Bordetella genomosp. 9]